MLLWWLATTALAEPCSSIPALTERAWSAFEDAELDQARALLAEASASFWCQPGHVSTEQLLGVYRLDALVSLTQEDRKSAVYATIRAVTIDPDAVPGDDLGPDIAALHQTWATRLRDSTATIEMTGEGEAWVDGRALEPGEQVTVLAGEHLIQYRSDEGSFRSEVRDVATNLVIRTGESGEQMVVVAQADSAPSKPSRKPPQKQREGPRTALLIAGGTLIGAGAGTVGYAWTREQRFLGDDYVLAQFKDPSTPGATCAPEDACYERARQAAIIDDATVIRTTYALGYVAAGLGVGLLGLELVVLPGPTGTTVRAGVGGTW